jgi:hypothetical protein
MTRNEPISPPLFTVHSSDSLSSVNSEASDISRKVISEKPTIQNIGALFEKIVEEKEVKTNHAVTNSMASFLKWTEDYNKRLKK